MNLNKTAIIPENQTKSSGEREKEMLNERYVKSDLPCHKV